MLTLQDIFDKKDEIKPILERHHVSYKDCKIFGSIVNQEFPISANAHFLVIPGQNTDQQHWDSLVNEISQLFPKSYLKFYAPGHLASHVALGELDQKVEDKVMSEAKSLQELFLSFEKENEKKKDPNELATDFSLSAHELTKIANKNKYSALLQTKNNFFKCFDSATNNNENTYNQEYQVFTNDVQALCSSLSNRSTCSSSEIFEIIIKLAAAMVDSASPSIRLEIAQKLSNSILSFDNLNIPTSAFDNGNSKPCKQ